MAKLLFSLLGALGYSLKEDERPNPEESFNSDEDDLFFNNPELLLKFLLVSSISVLPFSKTFGLTCLIAGFVIFFFFF